MLTKSRGVETNKSYKLKNTDADNLVQRASEFFKHYTRTRKDDPEGAGAALKQSLSLYSQAVDLCRSSKYRGKYRTDTAFCCRRYAAALMRDESRDQDVCYRQASDLLEYSIMQYETFLASGTGRYPEFYIKMIHTELQHALSLLGHTAFKLMDGELLEATVQKQLISTDYEPNPELKLEALTWLYHVCMSKNQIDNAESVLDEISKVAAEHELQSKTDWRHMVKINMLKLSMTEFRNNNLGSFFSRQIQDVFWVCFEGHQDELKDAKKNLGLFVKDLKSIHKNILDDLRLLLIIKVIQKLYGIDERNPDESIIEYMQNQTENIYFPESRQFQMAMKATGEIISRIQNEEGMTLALPLFDNETPARIAISKVDFARLFPDFNPDLQTPQRLSQRN